MNVYNSFQEMAAGYTGTDQSIMSCFNEGYTMKQAKRIEMELATSIDRLKSIAGLMGVAKRAHNFAEMR